MSNLIKLSAVKLVNASADLKSQHLALMAAEEGKAYQKVFTGTPGKPTFRREHNLLFRADAKTYYVRISKAGKPELFESLDTGSLQDALSRRDQRIAEYVGSDKWVGKAKRRTVGQVCEEVLADCIRRNALPLEHDQHRRAETLKNDRNMLPRVADLFGGLDLVELTTAHWVKWRDENDGKLTGRRGKPMGMGELAKYLSLVTSWSAERGYIAAKPEFPTGKTWRRKGRAYTATELADLSNISDPATRLQVCLIYQCGFRTIEARILSWDRVKFRRVDGKDVTEVFLPWQLAKTKEDRTIWLSDDANALMRAWKASQGGASPYVFPAALDPSRPVCRVMFNRRWNRAKAEAGITGKANQYWLRHTFYTQRLVVDGLPVIAVGKYGGTSAATLEKHYLDGANNPHMTASVALASSDKSVTFAAHGPASTKKKQKKAAKNDDEK